MSLTVADVAATAFPTSTTKTGHWARSDVIAAAKAGLTWAVASAPAMAALFSQLGPVLGTAGESLHWTWLTTVAAGCVWFGSGLYTFARLVQTGPAPTKG